MMVVLVPFLLVLAAAVGLALGHQTAPAAGAVALLAALWCALTLAAGAHAWALVLHACNARWARPLHRLWEAGFVLWVPVLLLGLVVGVQAGAVFPWAGAGAPHDHHLEQVLAHRAAWHGHVELAARGAAILVVTALPAILLWRWSRAAWDDPPRRRHCRGLAAAGLPVLVLAISVATLDWVFASSPAVNSAVLPLQQLVSGALAAIGAVAAFAWLAWRRGNLLVGAGQWYALGTLLVATSCLWAYLHFSQVLVITMSDLPHEAEWLDRHRAGVWGAIGVTLLVGRFALPFLALLRRRERHRPGLIAGLGALQVPLHALEALWLIAPGSWTHPTMPGWRDALALVLALALVALALAPLVRRGGWRPQAGPGLDAALAHHPGGGA